MLLRCVSCVAVPVTFESLNSGDCFVLASIPEYCIVWMGSGSSDAEKETASVVAAFVNPVELVYYHEGAEDEGFWEVLGGKGTRARVCFVVCVCLCVCAFLCVFVCVCGGKVGVGALLASSCCK